MPHFGNTRPLEIIDYFQYNAELPARQPLADIAHRPPDEIYVVRLVLPELDLENYAADYRIKIARLVLPENIARPSPANGFQELAEMLRPLPHVKMKAISDQTKRWPPSRQTEKRRLRSDNILMGAEAGFNTLDHGGYFLSPADS